MFFAKRRWALRVIEGTGVSASSELATELVDMIIQGAKQYPELTRHVGQSMSDPELVLPATAAMAQNQSAVSRLQELGMSLGESQAVLNRVHEAGRDLAETGGYTDIVKRMYRGP